MFLFWFMPEKGSPSSRVHCVSQAITNSNDFGHLAIRGANNWAIQELLLVHDLAKKRCTYDDERLYFCKS